MAEAAATSGNNNDDEQPILSPAFHPLAIGNPGDKPPSHEDIVAVINILKDAGICCCFVDEVALNYYGAKRVRNDYVLCVPDEQHEQATKCFASHNTIFEPVGPSPVKGVHSLHHLYPRFKAIGRTDFLLILPASYCHIDCKPENIEWGQWGKSASLPYPKLNVYAQSMIDTRNGVDLSDLIDGMDLSEEWGEESLDLEGDCDLQWAQKRVEALRAAAPTPEQRATFLDPKPFPRREFWQERASIGSKRRRLGWKYSPEIYATRFRRHGSKDPRLRGMKKDLAAKAECTQQECQQDGGDLGNC